MRREEEPGWLAVFLSLFLLSGAGGDSGSWLSWSLDQAREASREAGSALYRGVKELACLQVECCNQDWRPANFSRLEADLDTHLVGQHLLSERRTQGSQLPCAQVWARGHYLSVDCSYDDFRSDQYNQP